MITLVIAPDSANCVQNSKIFSPHGNWETGSRSWQRVSASKCHPETQLPSPGAANPHRWLSGSMAR